MKKVLIAYFSATGTTQKMADYIAEGIRFSGNQAVTKKIGEIKDVSELGGYDGYIFGSPAYSGELSEPVKTFLKMAEKAGLEGKPAGTFGSYSHDIGYKHDTYEPAIIFDTLQNVHKMKPFELGAFALKEEAFETGEGIKSCQDYGKVFGEKLNS
jgi:flavodoxin